MEKLTRHDFRESMLQVIEKEIADMREKNNSATSQEVPNFAGNIGTIKRALKWYEEAYLLGFPGGNGFKGV